MAILDTAVFQMGINGSKMVLKWTIIVKNDPKWRQNISKIDFWSKNSPKLGQTWSRIGPNLVQKD